MAVSGWSRLKAAKADVLFSPTPVWAAHGDRRPLPPPSAWAFVRAALEAVVEQVVWFLQVWGLRAVQTCASVPGGAPAASAPTEPLPPRLRGS